MHLMITVHDGAIQTDGMDEHRGNSATIRSNERNGHY